jgi:hypothetical protein
MKATAHEIAAEPDLYNRVWKIGNQTFECYGYSRTGYTVIFADVEPTDDHKLRLIRRYVDPDKVLEEAQQ